MDIATKLTQIAEKEAENIELNNQLEQILGGANAGENSFYDEFWDAFQQNGERIDYTQAFYHWGAEYIRPKYKVIPKDGRVPQIATVSGYTAKYYSLIHSCPNVKKIEKEYFDLSQYYNAESYNSQSIYGNYYTFANNPNLEEIEDVGMQPYAYYNTFRWCPKLHTIEVVRSNEKTIFDQQVFHSCHSLKNIKIEGVITSNISFYQSPNLSRESIESIVNHLSNSTTAILTLSATAVNTAFKNGGKDSDEWKNLIAKKVEKGWSFNLI